MIRTAVAVVAVATAVALALAAAGCVTLDPIPRHACGNHVVEDSEDCDGAVSDSGMEICTDTCTWKCASPTAPGACGDGWNYDLGTGECCPSGYACGSDELCHAPSGQFRPVSAGAFAVDDLTVAQLDRQPGGEIVGLSDSAIDIVQLGSTGDVVSTQEVPVATAGAWSTGALEGANDQTAELLGSIGPGVVAFHAPSGQLETFPFTTFVIPDSQILTNQPSRVALLPNADPQPIIIAARQDATCATGTGVCAALVTDRGGQFGFPCGSGAYMPTDVVGDRLGIRAIAGGASLFAIGMRNQLGSLACVYTATPTAVPPDPPSVDLSAPTILDLPPGYSVAATGAMVFARVPGDSCPSLLVPIDDGTGLGLIGFARGSGAPCQISSTVVPLDNTFAMVPLLAGQIDGTGGDEVVTDTGVFPLAAGSPPTIPLTALAFLPRKWQSAAIGDINRDGLVDVVGSAPADDTSDGDDIDVLRQRPDGQFAVSKIFTANLVDQVRLEDVDGDLYDDVVFVEIDTDHEADVQVAFGAPAGGAPEIVHAASFPPFNGMSTVDDVLDDAALDDDGTGDLIVTTFTGGTVLYGSFTRHLVAPLVLASPTSVSYVSGTAIADVDQLNGADVVALADKLTFPNMPPGPPLDGTQVVVLLAGDTPGRYPDAPIEIPAGDLTSISGGGGVFTAASFHGIPILLAINHGGAEAPPLVQGFAITVDPVARTGTETLIGMVDVGGDKPATAPWGVEAVHVTDLDLDGDPDLLVDFGNSGVMGPPTTWLIQLHLDGSSHLIGTATEVRLLDTQCSTAAAIELDPLAPGRELVAGCAGLVVALATQNKLDGNDLRDIDKMVAGDVTGDGIDDLVMLRDLGTEHTDLEVLVQCTTRDPAPCAETGEGVKP